ncbi:hypothetical protein Tco_0719893 [Tanacetum coccineum]
MDIVSLSQPTPLTRRIPPPCWTNDETVALIEAYRDKWYSVRRGNLRAPHWQEVADSVSVKCGSDLPKTSIQCRHKMEKLRKRYRNEVQRIGDVPKSVRYKSTSWVHFKLMDFMELGLDPNDFDDDDVEGENEEDLMMYTKGVVKPVQLKYYNAVGASNGNANGVRIRIPSNTVSNPPVHVPALLGVPYYGDGSGSGSGSANRLGDDYPSPVNRSYGSGKRKEVEEEDVDVGKSNGNALDEMVAAINKLGDGFMKMEKMKMDMAREFQLMKMKMDMQRTQMIIESQQKLVDSFLSERLNKKFKRMPTPEA